jgi:hypothetical protein
MPGTETSSTRTPSRKRSHPKRARLVVLDDDLMALLEPEAAKRHTSASGLAFHLLAVIASDGLVEAVLDDGRS